MYGNRPIAYRILFGAKLRRSRLSGIVLPGKTSPTWIEKSWR